MEYFYFAFFLNIELDTVRGERGGEKSACDGRFV